MSGTPNPNQTLTLHLKTLLSLSTDIRPVYIVGNFNGWKTEDERFKMQYVKPGHYVFSFPKEIQLPASLEYKYVRGDWENQELDIWGERTQNRILEKPSHRGLAYDVVPCWMSYGLNFDPKFLPKRQLISDNFVMPQLGKQRRVEIWLPYDYERSGSTRYPVLYLHDAQNLANPHSPYGNWAIDQKMAVLAEQQKANLIIVGVEHGGADRIREYAPLDEQGKKHIQFMSETLKPFVDAHFRTRTERAFTGIGGSSLGGLISLYAGLQYAHLFGRWLIFSPSLWMTGGAQMPVQTQHSDPSTRVYLFAGGQESASMVPNVRRLKKQLLETNTSTHYFDSKLVIDPKGQHTEARWSQEFSKAVEWLFER